MSVPIVNCQFHTPHTLQDLAMLINRELGAGQGRCDNCGEQLTPSPHGEWNSDPPVTQPAPYLHCNPAILGAGGEHVSTDRGKGLIQIN